MNWIDGKTKTVALIGDPVEHSFSPFIHNHGFAQHDINMVYVNHCVKEAFLGAAVAGMRALQYVGANVTYPHKVKVIEYLDGLSKEAELIGAVNTIKNENGRLIGYNTDGLGFVEGLLRRKIDLQHRTVCLLGAGGAAKSIAIALALQFECEMIICNRTLQKAQEIQRIIQQNQSIFKGRVGSCVVPEDLDLTFVDMVINCTPVGMGTEKGKIPFEKQLQLQPKLILCDLIYQPNETALLQKGRNAGCITFNGLDMLIDQARLAFEIWTGKKLEYEDVKSRLSEKIYQSQRYD